MTRSKLPVRIGLALVTLVYLAYSSLGIAAPFWWGHHGYHGATYMLRARMSLRFHMLAPATYSGFDFPPANAFYFHHPIGYHHLLTLLIPIFGEHEWLARGVAVAGGLLAMWALYRLGRRAWSRELGLAAVAVWVCLPVVCSFSVLSDPMFLEEACVFWSLEAYFWIWQRPSARALVHTFIAYVIGGLMMWEVFFIAPFIAAHAQLGAWATRRGRALRLGRWNALTAHTLTIGAACVLTMGFHIWYTHHAGAWDEFLESYRIRHSPPSAQYVIDRHTQWVDILFGRAPVVVGAIWFVAWLARVALGRARLRDLLPLTFLYVNTLYIYMFAEGSSVHLYRVFFYSGFFTLAVIDLADDAMGAARRLAPRRLPTWAAATAVLALYFYAELPHAWGNLIESRVLMGTHGQGGYQTEQDKWLFAADVARRVRPDERIIIHYGHLGARKEMWFYIDRSFDEISFLGQLDKYKATHKKSVLMLDERLLTAGERVLFRELIRVHPVVFYDHYAMIDLRSNQPGARSYGFAAGPMSLRYKWLVSHKYAPLHLVRSAYFPGLCEAVTVGAPVAHDEEPPLPPQDPRLMPCYHNYLAARGDEVGAARVLDGLTAGLAPSPVYLGNARVWGGLVGGRLRVVVRADGPEAGELRYLVERPEAPQPLPRGALPPPSAWRPGQVYVDEVTLPGKPAPVEAAVELWQPAPARPPPPPPRPPLALPPVAPPPPPIILARAPLGTLDWH